MAPEPFISDDMFQVIEDMNSILSTTRRADSRLRARVAIELAKHLHLNEKENGYITIASSFLMSGMNENAFIRSRDELLEIWLELLCVGADFDSLKSRKILIFRIIFGDGGLEANDVGLHLVESVAICGVAETAIKSVLRNHIPELK